MASEETDNSNVEVQENVIENVGNNNNNNDVGSKEGVTAVNNSNNTNNNDNNGDDTATQQPKLSQDDSPAKQEGLINMGVSVPAEQQQSGPGEQATNENGSGDMNGNDKAPATSEEQTQQKQHEDISSKQEGLIDMGGSDPVEQQQLASTEQVPNDGEVVNNNKNNNNNNINKDDNDNIDNNGAPENLGKQQQQHQQQKQDNPSPQEDLLDMGGSTPNDQSMAPIQHQQPAPVPDLLGFGSDSTSATIPQQQQPQQQQAASRSLSVDLLGGTFTTNPSAPSVDPFAQKDDDMPADNVAPLVDPFTPQASQQHAPPPPPIPNMMPPTPANTISDPIEPKAEKIPELLPPPQIQKVNDKPTVPATPTRKQNETANDGKEDNIAPSTPAHTPDDTNEPPKTPLPQRIEWLEKELHAAHTLIMKLQQHEGSENDEEPPVGDTIMVELQANLQNQMNLRAEAEDTARRAVERAGMLEEHLLAVQGQLKQQTDDFDEKWDMAKEEKKSLYEEMKKLKEERDEQARKEAALTNRLNAAKKKEATKTHQAELLEEEVKTLQKQLDESNQTVRTYLDEKNKLQQQLEQVKKMSLERIQQLENSLAEEKKLNDDRKRKMKAFIETKAEETRTAKEDNESLQSELDQTNRSLMDLNQRWKQLHAQWLQSQTRNRELQRDMNKMKKDSEKLSKVEGTLEMKLSKSAQETEEHKNKRLTAKNELMAILRQLEAEKELSNRLRDCIKFTFTPKALSQQQLIHETLQEFEGLLEKLAARLGQTLPPPPPSATDSMIMDMNNHLGTNPAVVVDDDNNDNNNNADTDATRMNRSEATITRLISKLENETQRVSQCIMSFSTNCERLQLVLDAPGNRTCASMLADLLTAKGAATSSSTPEETTAMTSRGDRRHGGSSYGQLPSVT